MESPVQILRGDPRPSCFPDACPPRNASDWNSGWANGSAGRGNASESAHISAAIPVIITAVYSVVFVVGLVGNSLVMFVIIR